MSLFWLSNSGIVCIRENFLKTNGIQVVIRFQYLDVVSTHKSPAGTLNWELVSNATGQHQTGRGLALQGNHLFLYYTSILDHRSPRYYLPDVVSKASTAPSTEQYGSPPQSIQQAQSESDRTV